MAEVNLLVEHLSRTTRLTRPEATHIIDEVLAFFDVDVEAYVQERHRQLKRDGLKNEAIYALISDELKSRRFAAPQLTERQIRRLIYG